MDARKEKSKKGFIKWIKLVKFSLKTTSQTFYPITKRFLYLPLLILLSAHEIVLYI